VRGGVAGALNLKVLEINQDNHNNLNWYRFHFRLSTIRLMDHENSLIWLFMKNS